MNHNLPNPSIDISSNGRWRHTSCSNVRACELYYVDGELVMEIQLRDGYFGKYQWWRLGRKKETVVVIRDKHTIECNLQAFGYATSVYEWEQNYSKYVPKDSRQNG